MRRHPRPRIARAIDIVLILSLVLALAVGFAVIRNARQHLVRAQAAVDGLEASLNSGSKLLRLTSDPDQVRALHSTLVALDTELEALDRLARPLLPLCPYFGWLPGIGPDIEAAPHLLSLALETGEATRTLADGLLPLAQRLSQSEPGFGQVGAEVVSELSRAQVQIETAASALDRAAAARAALNSSELSPKTRSLLDRFDHYKPILDGGVAALDLVPELLGAKGPRTYLVLAQNNHELRATGGFVSGVGLIRLEGGVVSNFGFQDSYAVDDLEQPHPPSPDALRRHMGAGMLLLRDANWWPDFPTSAQTIADLYRQDQGQAVDGVIAIDLIALGYLLDTLGPIQVPDYEQPVTSANLESMIMTYWQAPRQTAPGKENTDWWAHRKDFAADLTASLLAYLTEEATMHDLTETALAATRALQESHIMLYVNYEPAQTAVLENDIGGDLKKTNGDYVMVVDSNVGFNKVNPNIDKMMDYDVVLDRAGAATALLTLTYQHQVRRPTPACVHDSYYGDGYEELMERCYWDVLRIYLPEGSEVLEVLGADEPAQIYAESGKTVASTFFLLENDQARQIQVAYHPKLTRTEGRYDLLLQKQAGTGAMPVRVSITPPEGAWVTYAEPEGIVRVDGRIVWQGDLAEDRTIRLQWRYDD